MRQKFHNRPFESSLALFFLIVFFCLGFPHCNPSEPSVAFEEGEPTSDIPIRKGSCYEIAPGLHKLGLGVDITQLDLLPLKATDKDGFKYPVIDFSCQEGRTRYLDGVRYDMPDQVISITDKPGGILKSEVYLFKKSSDVLKMMSANVGLDSITKGFFSASGSFKRLAQKIYNESRYIEYIVSHQSTRTAKLIPDYELKLGKYAKKFVDRLDLKSFESDPEKHFRFIEYFGTHYFSELNFGGTLQYYLETNESYYQGKINREVRTEATAMFYKFLKESGNYQGTVKRIDKEFTVNTNEFVRYYGGDTNLSVVGGINQWLPTINKNPWTFGGQLKPISELIEDKSKRESMEKAVQIYIDKAYIDSLVNLLNWAIKKYPSFDKQISSYKGQVKALNTSDHNAVIELGNFLEDKFKVPSWFLDNVKLCFKWKVVPDRGQCGLNDRRQLCANIGSMTSYFRDSTKTPGEGCIWQWGIQKPSYLNQSLFHKIEICQRWWPDGDIGQCGGGVGGAARTLCASVNEFTPEYRDYTDQRGGGCKMQWRLMVSDTAPIWFHNLKLCFAWYPDGDGGQCGVGKQKLLCAIINSWTAVYRDDTDNRMGSCHMSWGIYTSYNFNAFENK